MQHLAGSLKIISLEIWIAFIAACVAAVFGRYSQNLSAVFFLVL